MPRDVTVTWTCDRCQAIEKGHDIAFQPKDWATIRQIEPPHGSVEDCTTERFLLCPNCLCGLEMWRTHIDGEERP